MIKSRFFYRKARRSTQVPGTLVYTGEQKINQTHMRFFDYDADNVREEEVDHIDTCFALRDLPTVSWVNIAGLHETDLIKTLGNHFKLHPLIQEDIVHVDQRPKLEEMDNGLFVVMRMIFYRPETHTLDSEQISFVLGENFVISFQERVGDVFEGVRHRIRHNKGRVRKMGADYLLYCLIDAIVERYFDVMEQIGERIETLEDAIMSNPSSGDVESLYKIKRQLIYLRRSFWPLRETANGLLKNETQIIREDTIPFYRDYYDHVIQIVDMLETMRDMNACMFDMYLSNVSNRMNEVMKVLTIIATIFIPLTFIAGIYGMNFEFMPELKLKWGYFGVWGVMLVVLIGMIGFFKRKKWL